jgi:hypothetical protein
MVLSPICLAHWSQKPSRRLSNIAHIAQIAARSVPALLDLARTWTQAALLQRLSINQDGPAETSTA